MEEKRYKIEKIEKIDKKISENQKAQIFQICGAMGFAYLSYMMFGGYVDSEYLAIVRKGFGLTGTIFAGTSLYYASGVVENVLERAMLRKEKFDLLFDLECSDSNEKEEEKVLRK